MLPLDLLRMTIYVRMRYKVTYLSNFRSAVASPASGHSPPDSSLRVTRFTKLPSISNVYTVNSTAIQTDALALAGWVVKVCHR